MIAMLLFSSLVAVFLVIVLAVALLVALFVFNAGRVRRTILLFCLLPIALFVWSANTDGFHYKSGTFRCSVQQIDLEGIWSRTWEGVLLVGPAKRPWHVSAINDAPVKALGQARDLGCDVLVHYDVFYMRGWLRGSSEVVVTSVEAIR